MADTASEGIVVDIVAEDILAEDIAEEQNCYIQVAVGIAEEQHDYIQVAVDKVVFGRKELAVG